MAPLNYRSAQDCMFFTIAGKDFFRQRFQCTATQPSTDTSNPSVLLLTRQQGTVIICIEVKFGHRVLFNSVGNPWFHSWAGKTPGQGKDIGRGLLARSSRPPRRISQMFPLTGYPCVCAIQEISFLKRCLEWMVRMRSLGMPLHPSVLEKVWHFLGF